MPVLLLHRKYRTSSPQHRHKEANLRPERKQQQQKRQRLVPSILPSLLYLNLNSAVPRRRKVEQAQADPTLPQVQSRQPRHQNLQLQRLRTTPQTSRQDQTKTSIPPPIQMHLLPAAALLQVPTTQIPTTEMVHHLRRPARPVHHHQTLSNRLSSRRWTQASTAHSWTWIQESTLMAHLVALAERIVCLMGLISIVF